MRTAHWRTGLWIVYAVFWLGGVISGGTAPGASWTAPLFLVLAGSLALLENGASWKTLAAAGALGFTIELWGVHTGLPFGSYRYTELLAPAVWGVPVAIAFAWLLVISFVRGITDSPLAGAVLMTAADLVIDPLAAGPLHYWSWQTGGSYYGIPWTNFAGWLMASGLILAMTRKGSGSGRSVAGFSVLAFFTLLSLRYRFWFPALTGGLLLGLWLVPPAARAKLLSMR